MDVLPAASTDFGSEVPAAPVRALSPTRSRVASVDLLRGLVMVIMALDHTRDFVHSGAMAFQPENLAQTTPAIFFTRWITHLCAPAFMLCAGLGAWFRLQRGGSKADLSWILVTRGLWLIVLEFTVVRIGFFFNFDHSLLFLLVFWALGLSMIALALLVHLPWRALLAVSVGMIALHHLTDAIPAARFGAFAWLWQILHARGVIAVGGGTNLLVAYPLIPWIGVMAAGFCLGRVYVLSPDQRRTWLMRLGLAMIAAFVALRLINAYGDPSPWAVQSRGLMFTLLSFLNTTKYPPSLLFLLMTLGPALILLALFDRMRPADGSPLLVFGRTPLFYFVVHLPLIHALAIGLTWLRYGAAPFLFTPPPTLGTPRNVFPADYGWDLWVAYAVTGLVVVLMYPACKWLARVKARERRWWASYV